MADSIKTISDLEDAVNEFAQIYGKQVHNLPRTAIRVILWPTDKWIYHVVRGPTAIIRMGRLPDANVFGKALKNAIDHVARNHLYECLTLERVADIVKRENNLRRIQRERYNFDSELVPHMLRDEEIVIRRFSRVEVVHRGTGKREVIEFEAGQGNYFGMTEVAKSRLARRVHEQKIQEERDPFNLPISHPSWIAKTA